CCEDNSTDRPYCGPSYCFSSDSANCFEKHPAQLCMKAVYLCIKYIIAGPDTANFCAEWDRPTEEDPWKDLRQIEELERKNQWMNPRYTPEEEARVIPEVIGFLFFGIFVFSTYGICLLVQCVRSRQ
ncbi:unnamed protein product, partial [Effrenium voratum]